MSDTPLGRPTLPRRVLGANRRDSDGRGHLHHHWLPRCVWSRVGLGIALTRSAACRTFILGSGSPDCYRIGKGWMDQRDRSKRRLERWVHDVCGGRPRVQYTYKVGVYVTFFAALIYLSATFTRRIRPC